MKPLKHNPNLQVHLAVFLFGLTAILGGLIQLEALILVWWRVLLTAISLLFLTSWGKMAWSLPWSQIKAFGFIGCLMALHWLCFYGTIKIANASIALVTMALVSLFTAILEPILLGRKWDKKELFVGLAVIPGMVLVAGNLDISMIKGFGVGLLSALLAAIFSTLNKKFMDDDTPVFAVTLLEMIAAWLILGCLLMVRYVFGFSTSTFLPPTLLDWVYLVFLAVICTTIAQALNLSALKSLTAFHTNLVNNLEPIYGMILAAAILKEHEQLNTLFYAGSMLILGTVFVFPMIMKRSKIDITHE